MAAPLGTGSIADDDGAATVTTQKDKKVWVIDKLNGLEPYTYTNHGLVKTAITDEGLYTFKYAGTKLKKGTLENVLGKSKTKLFYKKGKLNKGYYKMANGDKVKLSFVYDGNGRICQQLENHTTKNWLGRKLQKARTLSTSVQDIARDSKGLPIQMREYSKSTTGAVSDSYIIKFDFERNNIVKARGDKMKSVFFTNRYKKVGKDQRVQRTTIERWNWVNHNWSLDATHFDPVQYSYKKMKVPEKFVKAVKAQQWALQNCNLNKAFGPFDDVAVFSPTWVEGLIF
jgi:hypothetical protein